MAIRISCPACSKRFKGPEKLAGKQIRCPACKAPFEVPLDAPMASESSTPRESPRTAAPPPILAEAVQTPPSPAAEDNSLLADLLNDELSAPKSQMPMLAAVQAPPLKKKKLSKKIRELANYEIPKNADKDFTAFNTLIIVLTICILLVEIGMIYYVDSLPDYEVIDMRNTVSQVGITIGALIFSIFTLPYLTAARSIRVSFVMFMLIAFHGNEIRRLIFLEATETSELVAEVDPEEQRAMERAEERLQRSQDLRNRLQRDHDNVNRITRGVRGLPVAPNQQHDELAQRQEQNRQSRAQASAESRENIRSIVESTRDIVTRPSGAADRGGRPGQVSGRGNGIATPSVPSASMNPGVPSEARPVTPKPPDPFITPHDEQLAPLGKSAVNQHYIDYIVGEPKVLDEKLRWYQGGSEATIGLRWGIGVIWQRLAVIPPLTNMEELALHTGTVGPHIAQGLHERIERGDFGEMPVSADETFGKVILLGSGSAQEIAFRASQHDLDAVVILQMSRQANGTQILTTLQARVRDVKLRQQQWVSDELSSGTVARIPETATNFAEAVLAEIDSRFALASYADRSEADRKVRIDQLVVSTRFSNVLTAIAEVRQLQNSQLLDTIPAGVKFAQILGIEVNQGLVLAGDDAKAKREILEALLAKRQ